MKREELLHVKKVLEKITNPSPNVTLAMAYIEKDLAQRAAQRDNFKGDYEESPNW